MKSNTPLKLASFLALIGIVSIMAGCPEPSAEEREKLLIDRTESQISDNNGISSANLCMGHDDKKHIYRQNHEFAELWPTCSERTSYLWQLPPVVILKSQCMKERFPSMSDPCLDCFGKMTTCTAEKCWSDCLNDSKGAECQDCAIRECSDEMFQCSGVPAIEIPDFKRD